MCSPEKVTLMFSIKNTQKNDYYSIKVSNEDLSLGDASTFETEEIKSSEDGKEIIFQKNLTYNYYFDKRQKFIINVFKKIKAGNEYNIKKNERHTTLSSLVTSPNSTYERPLNKQNEKKDILSIKLIKENNNPKDEIKSIFAFLKSGIKLCIFTAMDYSNGKNKESIDKRTNNYLNIIKVIVSKIGIYTNNFTSFYLHGYGAKLKNSKNNSLLYRSIFDIKIKEEDVLKINRNDLDYYSKNTSPDKKVHLSSLVRKITKDIYKLYQTNYYNVLFILARELTDEKDKQETIDAIIESSYLPLSIIIIGEGKNDFNGMNNLYGKKIKQASSGMDKNRNNIIFINYKDDFDENPSKMIEFCLRTINEQIINFYNLIKCSPQHIKLNKVENVGEGFNKYHSSICLYESKIISASQIGNVGPINNYSNCDFNDDVDEIKDEDNMDNLNINGTLNMQKMYNKNQFNLQKKNSKEAKKEKKADKNDGDIETPEGYFIPMGDSIVSNIKTNPYKNNNNDIQINQKNYNLNNNRDNMVNKCTIYNNYIQDNNNKINNNQNYIITPGQSVRQNMDNPYQKDAEDKKKLNNPGYPNNNKIIISPQDSVYPPINYNPNNKSPTPETPQPKEYIIPNQSIVQNDKIMENPYNKKYNKPIPNNNNYNYNQINEYEKNKIDNMSGASGYKNTNNSNYNDSLKDSNIIRNNYSIDTKII